jgi:hypothetical protein
LNLQQRDLHLIYSIVKKQEGYCDIELGRTTIAKQRNTLESTTHIEENHIYFTVMNYRLICGANIRICIVTVYNCIILVRCINLLFCTGVKCYHLQYLLCCNEFPISSIFRSLNVDHHTFIISGSTEVTISARTQR